MRFTNPLSICTVQYIKMLVLLSWLLLKRVHHFSTPTCLLQIYPSGALFLYSFRGMLKPSWWWQRGVVWVSPVCQAFSLENDAQHRWWFFTCSFGKNWIKLKLVPQILSTLRLFCLQFLPLLSTRLSLWLNSCVKFWISKASRSSRSL